jgi:Ni/Co efflux regulator RcnB
MMKRLLLISATAAAVALPMAGSADANKNTTVIPAECSNGETVEARVNLHAGERSGENAATPLVGGGSIKTTEFRLFKEGTEVFSIRSNYPREATVTCTGELTLEGETFEFSVSGVKHHGSREAS